MNRRVGDLKSGWGQRQLNFIDRKRAPLRAPFSLLRLKILREIKLSWMAEHPAIKRFTDPDF